MEITGNERVSDESVSNRNDGQQEKEAKIEKDESVRSDGLSREDEEANYS
jgi:hypothetical protein